ncbi:MAG: TonB-dependent receptor [Nitrospirae bacterium]|nr:TonB-dependent receptor [Nitrospirota bacterium]
MRIDVTGFSVCVVLLSCLDASTTHAQSEDVIETREVVVSSTRLPDAPVDARTLPAKVTIITAEDIRKSGARTVQEAIQWATGIVMYDQVGNAFQQTIDLRGFNGQPVPATSVFVDGARINEPDFNTVNFDLIPFDTIERIEILPGPSAIYGKNALGGVINIITKRGGEKHQVTGDTLWGSFSRQRYSINASGPLGKFDYYTNFGRETESGYRDDSAAQISRFYGRLGYRPTEQTDFTLSYTYVKDHLLQAGSLPLSVAAIDRKANFTPGDFTDNNSNVVRLTGRQGLPLGFSLNINGFYRRLNQEQFGVGQPAVVNSILSTAQTNSLTESRGGTAQLTQATPIFGHANTLILGTELQRNDFGGHLLSTSGFGPFNNRQDTNEDILGFFAQDTFNILSNLILVGGVRYDRNSIATTFEDTFTPPGVGNRVFHRTNPRAGLTYLVTPETSLYFNYSQGFRTPTFQELFQFIGTSNPFLKPVTSNNYEVGARSKLQNWGEASLAVFQSDVHNEIYFTCNNCDVFSAGFDGFNRNVDRSRRRGIEGTLKARYNQYVDGVVNYTYTEATFQSRFSISNTQTIEVGDSFPLVPKHRLSVTGNFHPSEGWTLSLIGLYVSTQFFLNDQTNSQPRLPGYYLLNSRIAYERPVPGGHLSGFLMVNNLLDQKYATSGTIASNTLTGGGAQERFIMPAPGIAIYGGLSYRFEGL